MFLKTQARFICALVCFCAFWATIVRAQNAMLLAENKTVGETVVSNSNATKPILVSFLPNPITTEDAETIVIPHEE